VNKPLISLCVGGVIKCVLNAVLVAVPAVNIMGAPIATCACYVVMIGMNLFFLRKYLTGCGAIILNTVKTLAASLVMGAGAYMIYHPLANLIGVRKGGLLAIMIAVVIYAALVILFKIVTVKELKSMVRRGR
ncbi:MAG: polysaccharide biosynthesis protein, partial [Clostridia bacterium]|nr:polysaccharide biosynthesis protein [Clostridia bacterium]